jgi:hypothetical protein
MSWVNPSTLEVLPHSVQFQPRTITEWWEVRDWCELHIGTQTQQWADSGAEMHISGIWHFLHQDDAVRFALTWGSS